MLLKINFRPRLLAAWERVKIVTVTERFSGRLEVVVVK